jgi:uncharacterized protein YgbK (DUF1537 family)
VLGPLGRGLAEVVRAVLQGTDVRRVVVAGGDVSGRVLRELGVSAVELEPAVRLGPGASWCRAVAEDASIDGARFLLKGGQIGAVELFESVRLS